MNEEAITKALEDLLGQVEARVPELVAAEFEKLQKAAAEAEADAEAESQETKEEETVEKAEAPELAELRAAVESLQKQLDKSKSRVAELEKVSKAGDPAPKNTEEDWVKESDAILQYVNAK